MGEDPDGRDALREGPIERFVPVADADYDGVRGMVAAARAAGLTTVR